MELQLIDWIRERIKPHDEVLLGPGDDAAILDMSQIDKLTVSTDMLTDKVDFDLTKDDPVRVGRKAVSVNLSDMAAMASRPVALVASVVLPRKGGMELGKGLVRGMLEQANRFGVALAGGDVNSWDQPAAISVTIFGDASEGSLRRDGAKPGDALFVTGALGGSILGKQFDFTPRVDEAIVLRDKLEATAAIDISDGLAIDLGRLAKASGVGVDLYMNDIPIDPMAHQMNDDRSPLEHALYDGEDFELLVAVPATLADKASQLFAEACGETTLTHIGQLTEGQGVVEVLEDGTRRPLAKGGWIHDLS